MTHPKYIVESVRPLPESSTKYELVFRAGDGTIHRLLASIERNNGVAAVTFDPHDPVFTMQGGDDPRLISRLVTAFDHARRGDLSGWREGEDLESHHGSEAIKQATIHFDGGGQSPGPVTAA